MSVSVEIQLLGELCVTVGGVAHPLPASRKARALLGHLVVEGQRIPRQTLCDALWEGPDDPRGALRWCLSRIRNVAPELARCLGSDRNAVWFETGAASTDLGRLAALVPGPPAAADVAALSAATALFRGELMAGLELPGCYAFQQWLTGHRERLRRLQVQMLCELGNRDDDAARALAWARQRVAIDPLSEEAHVLVIERLRARGDFEAARAQCEQYRRIVVTELDAAPSARLRALERELTELASRRAPSPAPPAATPPTSRAPFTGRDAELLTATSWLGQQADPPVLLLVVGDPGIGKTRLLQELQDRAVSSGGRALFGRSFELEQVRPYGVWFDLLEDIERRGLAGSSRERLRATPADRNQLYEQIAAVLSESIVSPTVLAFDDLQWLDEASAAMLLFVLRRRLPGLRVCASMRPGELVDNPAVLATLRTLAREGAVLQIALSPLDEPTTQRLVARVAAEVDAAVVWQRSGGNPLVAIELARAMSSGLGDTTAALDALIDDRLARLDDAARELLPWAAALGRQIDVEVLERATAATPGALFDALADLEQTGVLVARGDRYDFAHDVMRSAAYRRLSAPRRKLVHRQIARRLAGEPLDPGTAGDVGHHAALGGDAPLAVRAFVAASARSLRLFAAHEALSFATRGLHLAAGVDGGADALTTRIELLRIAVLSASSAGTSHSPQVRQSLEQAANRARELGVHAQLAATHYLLSVVGEDSGQLEEATEQSLSAALAGRRADPTTAAEQLANSARCLVQLETDLPRARSLLSEAQHQAEALGLESSEIYWCLGLLRRWDGAYGEASILLARARTMAAESQDRWRECQCLCWLATIALEDERPADARAYCAQLAVAAERLGEGATAPFGRALDAVARLSLGDRDALLDLDAAVAALRAADAPALLARVLNHAARCPNDAARALALGTEALAAAEAASRRTERVHARCTLARLAKDGGDSTRARALVAAESGDEQANALLDAGSRARLAATLAYVAALD